MLKTIEVERQKDTIRKNTKLFSKIFSAFGWIGIFLACLIHLPFFLTALANINDNSGLGIQVLAFSTSAVQSITAIFILFTIASLFKDISNSKSPISRKLINSLRLTAILLLMIFVITFFSQFFIPDFNNTTGVEGLFEVGLQSNGNRDYINVNFEYLFSALFCYCLSYVFKYTLYLQQSTDDTI